MSGFRRGKPHPAILAVALALLVTADSSGQEPQASIRPSDIIEQFDIDPDGDLLIVPVTIDRKRYPFILDTGTTLNAYDTLLRSHLGPVQQVIDVSTASGKETIALYDPPRAYLGRFNLRTPEGVTSMDMAGVRRATGHEFYGIIGMSFLLDRVVRLDFDAGKLAFLRSNAPRLETPVPLAIVREMPRVEVDFEGLGVRSLLVDTGSVGMGCGNLRSPDFDLLLKRGDLTLLGSGLGADLSQQQLPTRYGSVKRLAVGRERHDGLVFSDHVSSDILGMGFWKRYNVTFDFPNHVIYLQTHQNIPSLDDPARDRSGLHLVGKDGRLVVRGVDHGSPAARAGIVPGDLLAQVDGKDTSELTIRTIRRRLGDEGQEVRLSLRRGEQAFDAVLELSTRRVIGTPAEAPAAK